MVLMDSQMSAAITFAPCSANRMAAARPWPRAAPVMNTTLPSSTPTGPPSLLGPGRAEPGPGAATPRSRCHGPGSGDIPLDGQAHGDAKRGVLLAVQLGRRQAHRGQPPDQGLEGCGALEPRQAGTDAVVGRAAEGEVQASLAAARAEVVRILEDGRVAVGRAVDAVEPVAFLDVDATDRGVRVGPAPYRAHGAVVAECLLD